MRNPLPSDLDDPDQPYNGEYVRYDPAGHLAIFRSVIDNSGDTDDIDDASWSHFDPDWTVFSIGPPVVMQQPPRPWLRRNIPPDTDDLVNQMPITEGMDMVDFHGEYGFGRYYPLEVYNALAVPKENPMTRQTILPADVQYYTAHISAPIGGRRRKTKKSKRRARKTRRRQY
jgi:hypothetical protein